MADIDHEIKIEAPIEKTYNAITTLDGLRSWHTADIEGHTNLNDILTFISKSNPIFNWKIVHKDPEKIAWECIKGPGVSIGTEVIYKLSKTDDNKTLVELSHKAWPGKDGNFRKCNTLWGILLYHLKTYVETDKADPFIK